MPPSIILYTCIIRTHSNMHGILTLNKYYYFNREIKTVILTSKSQSFITVPTRFQFYILSLTFIFYFFHFLSKDLPTFKILLFLFTIEIHSLSRPYIPDHIIANL